MNITLVTETYPPEINGVAMTLQQLVEGLIERGHQVTVVRPRQRGEAEPGATGSGKPWREVIVPGFPLPGYTLLRLGLPAGRRLKALWRETRPDVVHVATEGPLGWSALRAAKSMGLPLTSTFHTNFHEYGRHYGAPFVARSVLRYLRWFHNQTTITLAPTAELVATLAADGFAPLGVLGRGVNTRTFAPARRDDRLRQSWGAGPEDLVVIHVSRLAAEKNYPLLLKTYAAIAREIPKVQFVIASDGPLRRALQKQFPQAHYTGFLERSDLGRHYASADLFLYPSQTETFGNVVTEAMASGLPVLAYHYAAPARYIKTGVNGWTVPFGDEAKFMEAALHLAQRRALGRSLGAAARLTAESIRWDDVVQTLENALTSAARRVPVEPPAAGR